MEWPKLLAWSAPPRGRWECYGVFQMAYATGHHTPTIGQCVCVWRAPVWRHAWLQLHCKLGEHMYRNLCCMCLKRKLHWDWQISSVCFLSPVTDPEKFPFLTCCGHILQLLKISHTLTGFLLVATFYSYQSKVIAIAMLTTAYYSLSSCCSSCDKQMQMDREWLWLCLLTVSASAETWVGLLHVMLIQQIPFWSNCACSVWKFLTTLSRFWYMDPILGWLLGQRAPLSCTTSL